MTNVNDREWLNTNLLKKSNQFNTARRTECFFGKVSDLDQSNINTVKFQQINQYFKVPSLPVNKSNVMSLKSPIRRVETGRVKNDIKVSQQSKMSFLPRPSFINSRRTLHCARGGRLNCRKEVIKKMVFLAECALKENREIKQSPPVKTLAGLTPRKTSRPKGYLLLPDLKQIGVKLNLGTPIPNLTKAEKSTPVSVTKKKEILENSHENKCNIKEELELNLKSPASDKKTDFTQILRYCRIYNTEVGFVYGKLKFLEECFESNLKSLPDYKVYEEFCLYQTKKQELYGDLKVLEEKLENSVKNQTQIGGKLKEYVKQRKELFNKRSKLHKDFEEVVKSAMEKCEHNERLEDGETEVENQKNETPKLRRSIRLSKITKKKNTAEEKTPMTKKLKKLDSKSKGIQRGRRYRSP